MGSGRGEEAKARGRGREGENSGEEKGNKRGGAGGSESEARGKASGRKGGGDDRHKLPLVPPGSPWVSADVSPCETALRLGKSLSRGVTEGIMILCDGV